MFRISRFRTTDIHRRTEQLGQCLGINIVFSNKLTMFAGILIYIYRLTIKTKTVTKQCNHVYTYLSLLNKDLPVRNIVFTTNIRYL